MKILLFAEVYYPDIIGGGEISTRMMTEGLVSRGHSVVVYCLGEKDERIIINGVLVHRRYCESISEYFLSRTKNHNISDPLSTWYKIKNKRVDVCFDRKSYNHYLEIINEETPDLIHSVSGLSYLGRYNLWKAAYDMGIPASHVCRSAVLTEIRFLNGILNPLYRRMNANASKYLSAMAAPTNYTLRSHYNSGICGKDYNKVIYNAIDFNFVMPSIKDIENKENYVLYAGVISKEKGIFTLIHAIQELENVGLLIVGEGECKMAVSNLDNVKVIDWLDRVELYEYMRYVKVICLPSECNEAFGRVLIEGIANGTIAVGSDKGGIPEVLNNDGHYIFKSGNHKELGTIIRRIMQYSNEEYLSEIIKQQKVPAAINVESYVDKWEEFFFLQMKKSMNDKVIDENS